MFTGITAALGSVRRLTRRGEDALLEVETALDLDDVRIGDSIAVSGACLTVTAKADRVFTADVSAETLSRTTLRSLKAGDRVNLEKALCVMDRLGGHIVLGHVDGIGRIVEESPAPAPSSSVSKSIRRWIAMSSPRGRSRWTASA